MNRWTILIITIGAILILVVGALVLLFTHKKEEPLPSKPVDAFGNTIGEDAPIEAPKTTRTTPLAGGGEVEIPDPTLLPQEEGHVPEQGYVIAGGYESAYRIIYYPAARGGIDRFLVSLNEEPLGQARLEAEAAFRDYTGLSNGQLCRLADVSVWAVRGVNEMYEGRDLGLSTCPGATQLP